jgi:hypothetical protein
MKNFIFYEKTGKILQSGTCADSDLIFQYKAGYLVLEGVGSDFYNYVQNGQIKKYTPEEIYLKRNLQQGWIWQMPERIAIDTRALEQAKVIASDQINKCRDLALSSFDRFTYDSVVYDGNATAQENIRVTAFIANSDSPLPEGFSWRSFDNVDVPMNKEKILGLQAALLQSLATITFNSHKIARGLKSEIGAATTNKQVDAITWPS